MKEANETRAFWLADRGFDAFGVDGKLALAAVVLVVAVDADDEVSYDAKLAVDADDKLVCREALPQSDCGLL